MAVQPARRGPSGAVYALIFFVFLAVVGIGLAVLFYTQLQESRESELKAVAERKEFIRDNEINDARLSELRAAEAVKSGDRSVFTEAETRRSRLMTRFTGQGNMSLYDLEKQLKEMGIEDGGTVMAALQTMQKEIEAAQTVNAKAEEQINAANAQLAELKAQYEKLAADRATKIQGLEAQIAKLETDQTAYKGQVDTRTEALDARLKQEQDAAAAQIRQRETEIKNLSSEIAKLELRIKQIIDETKNEKPDAPDLTRQPDGRVVSVSPEAELVYIDLGRGDHLVLGTTFEVFDLERGVEVGPDGELRGKASIEVIDVGETSSTARIARGSLSRPIVQGDLIANLVYDKSRVFKFYVFGDFDLDNDGEPSLADHDLIVSLIRRWGGEVADARQRERGLTALLSRDAAGELLLPLDTDYLIIGEEPEIPAPLPPGGASPQEVARQLEAKKKWETFLKLRQEAQVLSVPIINQHRFLALIGYYR